MKDHSGCKRAFVNGPEAWYAKAVNGIMEPSVNIGFYADEGGTTGEFAVRWHELSGRLAPRLEVFYDAWDALNHFKDVLDRLAEHDGEKITPKQLCDILLECGLEDITERVQS